MPAFQALKSNDPLAVVISPDLPPKRGGVADHTYRLLQELVQRMAAGVVTSAGNSAPEKLSVMKTVPVWNDPGILWSTLASLPDHAVLVWQYVPHMYGRGGVNPAIPEVVARWRKEGRRQMVIVHELYAPWSILPKPLAARRANPEEGQRFALEMGPCERFQRVRQPKRPPLGHLLGPETASHDRPDHA